MVRTKRAKAPLCVLRLSVGCGFARTKTKFHAKSRRKEGRKTQRRVRCLVQLFPTNASRMRSAVRPSQSGGMRRVDLLCGLSNAPFAAVMILVVSVPAIVFVPMSTVIGRSVFSRSVIHGTDRKSVV